MGYSYNAKDHIHLYDGKPLVGTSTAKDIIAKGGLTWWASGMACAEFGWLNPKKHSNEDRLLHAELGKAMIELLSKEKYLALLDKAYKAHSVKLKTSAGEGTDLHALIEEFIKSRINGINYVADIKLKPFIEWTNKNVKRFLFSEVHCYSKPLWVGGIADFGYVDMEGRHVLGDIKSSKEAYFSQWVQLAGYDIQIDENGGFDAKGNQTFGRVGFVQHAIFAAGAGLDKPFFNKGEGLHRTKQAFRNAVNLYKDKMFFEKDKEVV